MPVEARSPKPQGPEHRHEDGDVGDGEGAAEILAPAELLLQPSKVVDESRLAALGFRLALTLALGIGVPGRGALHQRAQRRQQDLVGGELEEAAARPLRGAI